MRNVRLSAKRADERVADRLGAMTARQCYQEREPGLAFDQRGDRRALRGADDQVTFPVPSLAAGLHAGRPVLDRLHGRGLLERAIAGPATAAAMPVGPPSAQVLPVRRDDQAAVDRLVDSLSAHVPAHTPPVTAPQPPADLGR